MEPAQDPVLLFDPKSGDGKANAAFLDDARARHIESSAPSSGRVCSEQGERASEV